MKKNNLFYLLSILLFVFAASACSLDDGDEKTVLRPVIRFDAPEDVYRIKAGASLWLEPEVENSQGASYRWILDGKTVGTDVIYLFHAQNTGRYFVTFEVSNSVYTVEKEVRVDVAAQLPPAITLPVPEGGFILLAGTAKTFEPTVANVDEETSYQWTVRGHTVAQTKDHLFLSDVPGEFPVVFTARNQDGPSSVEFNVSVRNAEDIPFSWEWEKDEYSMTLGRTLLLRPRSVANEFEPVYTWQHGDALLQRERFPELSFTPRSAGEYLLTVTMENAYLAVSKNITVEVFDNEDGFMRPVTEASLPDAVNVWEYLPAPGQFVNENYTADNMAQACAYAKERFDQQAYVSLGAFGGYVTVGFDHSVVNDGGYNLQVLGNSFDGSSEPGIVWVMQDENGDGMPNDTWYELKGSEFGNPGTIYNYAVTYYKPERVGMDVAWTDNQGNSGTIDYLAAFHKQDYYYPNWVKTGSYTLYGTRLQDRTYDASGTGTYWINGSFDWGYADNFGSDRLTDNDNAGASVNANHFRIGDAVDRAGNPVDLKYIDFVKIQTAVQAKAGWLGENSTEVFGVKDYNMIK